MGATFDAYRAVEEHSAEDRVSKCNLRLHREPLDRLDFGVDSSKVRRGQRMRPNAAEIASTIGPAGRISTCSEEILHKTDEA